MFFVFALTDEHQIQLVPLDKHITLIIRKRESDATGLRRGWRKAPVSIFEERMRETSSGQIDDKNKLEEFSVCVEHDESMFISDTMTLIKLEHDCRHLTHAAHISSASLVDPLPSLERCFSSRLHQSLVERSM